MPKELSELVERSRNLMATTLIRATVYLIGPTPEVVKQHFLPVAKAIGPSLYMMSSNVRVRARDYLRPRGLEI